jgi:hypothetical protein
MHAPITDIHTLKRVCLWLGIAGLLVGCAMTFEFGRAMSYWHAISLCILSVAVALMWPFVDHLWRQNSRIAAVIIGVFASAFTLAEFGSHLGYTVGHRVRDSQETGVQNVTYQQAQDSLSSETENLKLWRDQLAKLQEQHAWAPTVSADGLRAKLASHDKAIQLETARGGCKGKCLTLMKAKADTEEKIAIAEQASDLKKRIEATQRILDRKGDTARATEFKSSKLVNQTAFAAQLWTANINPDGESKEWTNIGIGFLISLVTTFLPAIMLFIAFRDAPLGHGAPAPARKPMAGSVPSVQAHAEPTFGDQLSGMMAHARGAGSTIVRQVGGTVAGRDCYGRSTVRHVQAA